MLRRVSNVFLTQPQWQPRGLRKACYLSTLTSHSLPPPKNARPSIGDYTDLAAIAMQLYTAGIQSVSSESMVRSAFQIDPSIDQLKVHGHDDQQFQAYDIIKQQTVKGVYKLDRNVHIIAVGKAVTGMARVAEELFGDHIVNAITVVPEGMITALTEARKWDLLPKPGTQFQIIEAGDGSLPCEKSLEAAHQISHLASSLTANDILITLFSGGGSSLITLPKPPITIEAKRTLTKLMKAAGVITLDMNAVRKNLSLIKGGGLAEMAAPAQVISLILSNLPHAQASDVASGPTTADYSTPHQALEILRKYDLLDKVPDSIMKVLRDDAKNTSGMKWFSDSLSFTDIYSGPKPRYDVSSAVNIMAGSDEIAVSGILRQCAEFDVPACAIHATYPIKGTVSAGQLFAIIAQYVSAIITRSNRMVSDSALAGNELECIKAGMTKFEMTRIVRAAEEASCRRHPVCLIFTSEIATEVKGTGIGGPCQETALATAIELQCRYTKYECLQACDVQLFSIDSDGMDGSTPVAGAIADCFQAKHKVNGKTAQEYLENNDSFSFYAGLEGGKYHVRTGVTGTDIQNFQLLLVRNRTF